MNLLRGKKSWSEVMSDDRLALKTISSYSSMRKSYADMCSFFSGGAKYPKVYPRFYAAYERCTIYGGGVVGEVAGNKFGWCTTFATRAT